jgi:phage shock protein PspC (stress-responsive transcriptional regulator)
MVNAGTISAEEADRLLETLERETTTMDCPLCGEEIRAEAVKCPHCRQFLTEGAHRPHRLTKSHDKMLAGVCAGVGEYGGVDASVVRLLTVLVVVFSGFVTGLVAYLIAALILPDGDPLPVDRLGGPQPR